MYDLNNLVANLGGWTLTEAEGVNDSGVDRRLWNDRRSAARVPAHAHARAVHAGAARRGRGGPGGLCLPPHPRKLTGPWATWQNYDPRRAQGIKPAS